MVKTNYWKKLGHKIQISYKKWKRFDNVKRSLFIVTVISLLFFFLIGFDTFPFLRGPRDWQWAYLFVNTLPKIFPSLFFIVALLYFFHFLDSRDDKKIVRFEKIFLPLLVLLFFLFQLSVIFFSRAGIFVLLARIIVPVNNGYFTASLNIKTLHEFLGNYTHLLSTFSIHSSQHPPGAIILFYLLDRFFEIFPFFNNFINTVTISTKSVSDIWLTLLPNQKTAAIFASFLVPLLSSAIIVPFYYLCKLYGNVRIALRGTFLYLFLPSIVLFTPLPDVIFPIFSIVGFYLLTLFFKKNNPWYLLLSGFILSLGIFFSLFTFFLVIFFYIALFTQNQIKKRGIINLFIHSGYLLLGIITPFVILYLLFHFNIIDVSMNIHERFIKTIGRRAYLDFLFYNLYDFFIFSGIPVFIYFIYLVKANFKKMKNVCLFLSFIITLLLLDFFGDRGETSRIFIPLYPFLLLLVTSFLNKKYKLKTKDFLLLYSLQAIQILIMQEFWVTLW